MSINITSLESHELTVNHNEINILTHNGLFHSDEVFASALLIHFYAKTKVVNIIRSRNESLIKVFKSNPLFFMLDIGSDYNIAMRNFDHHQQGVEVEEKASVMLVLDYLLSVNLITVSLYEYLKENLIQFLNNWDLGLEQAKANFSHKPLPTIISSFNRYDVSPEIENVQFRKALDIALSVIENENEAFKQLSEAKKGFMKHTALHNGVIMFNDFNPQYAKLLKQCEGVKYYIHPMKEDWVVKTTNSFTNPLPMVEDESELVFAHKNRFLSIFKSKNAAISYISNAYHQI
jgi:uncharacterized UPF0160 family protein